MHKLSGIIQIKWPCHGRSEDRWAVILPGDDAATLFKTEKEAMAALLKATGRSQ